MRLFLRDEFAYAWEDRDPFSEVAKLKGEVFREVKERITLRFEMAGNSYFLKLHRGIGWREIFKNLLGFKIPILGAGLEYSAINRLKELGIETMTVAAFGERGVNPAARQSFIITDDLTGTESLEDYCKNWPQQAPDYRLKKLLIDRVAHISRVLHGNGLNHRDYYICHFHLDLEKLKQAEKLTVTSIRLHLIDLHRMQQRGQVPERWRVKDIGGLYFSALDIGLTERDIFRFIRGYTGQPLKQAISEHAGFWRKVETRARKMYRSFHGRDAQLPTVLGGRL